VNDLLWVLGLVALAILVTGALAEWYGNRMVGRLPRKPLLPEHHHDEQPPPDPSR
jgi:hypothetical protein